MTYEQKETEMDKRSENLPSNDRNDVVVLGTASVETRGGGGATNEPLGKYIVPGIDED